ncbi:hypothetical protein FRB97_009803 [Tulasnella sp. 331]|nr:hypothetical protein FRB97_009803 [Tulasnella sp. 331]
MTVRGKKQVAHTLFHSYATAVKPDIIFALSDILFVPQPPSERRVIKSLERSLRWLSQLLRTSAKSNTKLPNIIVHMVGGIDDVARDDFATGLTEALEGANAMELKPLGLETLEEGVSGFSFDLVPLKKELLLTGADKNTITQTLINLVQISLKALPKGKPRLLTGANSPHEILHFVRIGIDVFDAHFAQRAADWGIALDFRFPARDPGEPSTKKREIGVNLYGETYSMDFGRLAENFRGEALQDHDESVSTCPCIACSPRFCSSPLLQSSMDRSCYESSTAFAPPFTRAYLHHLLHTHEMSAHAMLAAHNISVFSKFLTDLRNFIETLHEDVASFKREVQRFHECYIIPDVHEGLFERAKGHWEDVNLTRGKGRLAREKLAKENAVIVESGVAVDQNGLSHVAMEGTEGASGVPVDVFADEVMGG